MSIQVSAHARISVEPKTPFQNIREVVARGRDDYSEQTSAKGKLCASYLHCQKGMKDQATTLCLQCPRLVNFVPQNDSVLVRCLWTDEDRVEDLMTLASEFVTVSPTTRVWDADIIARKNQVRHLLVVEQGRLYGVLCRCDLAADATAEETVAERVNHCPWTISPSTTLAQAAQLMRERQIGMLPVIHNKELIGVVTRGDLRRAGLAEALLGAKQCGSCQGTSGVFAHPEFESENICLDCHEQPHQRLAHAGLGG